MKLSKFFAALFALAGIAAAAFTVWLCLNSLHKEPVMLQEPQTAVSRVDALFQAVCNDDFEAASQLLYGTPDLVGDRGGVDKVSSLIWDAFVDSIGYDPEETCTATQRGIAQKVRVSYLDISSVTDGLQERSRTLLQQRVAEAEDVEEIYDENNDYRQDFVDGVVLDAAREALRQDARYVETELTVELVYVQGQWWILADEALMQVISGGIGP